MRIDGIEILINDKLSKELQFSPNHLENWVRDDEMKGEKRVVTYEYVFNEDIKEQYLELNTIH